MAKAQPDHYYGFGVGAHKCVRCGVMRRPMRTSFGKPHSWKAEWSHDGGATWTQVHTGCPMMQSPKPVRTEVEAVIAWLWSEDARSYTEVGPLIAKALEEGRHLPFLRDA